MLSLWFFMSVMNTTNFKPYIPMPILLSIKLKLCQILQSYPGCRLPSWVVYTSWGVTGRTICPLGWLCGQTANWGMFTMYSCQYVRRDKGSPNPFSLTVSWRSPWTRFALVGLFHRPYITVVNINDWNAMNGKSFKGTLPQNMFSLKSSHIALKNLKKWLLKLLFFNGENYSFS